MNKYDSKFVPDPFGFINLGSTCYFNALLQCIISCPSFIRVLIKNKDVDEYQKNEVVISLIKMSDIMNDINIPKNEKEIFFKNLAPTIWKTVFEKAILRQDKIKFTPGQECAGEGFDLFLDSLDGLSEIQNLFMHRYQTLIFCQDCNKWVVNKECEYSIFTVPPSLISPQHPRFQAIDPHYNLTRSLEDFLKKQNGYVDSDTKCPECKKKQSMFQTTRLLMIPEILVVLSKKYDTTGRRKTNTITNFPNELNFSGKGDDEKTIPMEYKAVAQIEHMGHIGGGHYTCNAMRKNGKWYNLNDTSVSDGEFKPTSNTYLVFYHFT
jgi:ubiquitin C-terminal hydrolase